MNFPDVVWGMTKEEVCDALALEESEYEVRMGQSYSITNVCLRIFGEDAHVTFKFDDQNEDAVYTLFSIQVVYPAKANMETIKAELEVWYGEPTEHLGADEILWESEAMNQDIMTEADRDYLQTQNSVAQRELTEAVTTIRCYQNYRPLTLDGLSTTNVLVFDSSAAFYMEEGGFTAQMTK